MSEEELYQIKMLTCVAISESREHDILKKGFDNLFQYVDILKKENELKTEKLDKLYNDNMILHKEIILLLENKEK